MTFSLESVILVISNGKKESVMEQFITLAGIIFLSGVIGYVIGSRSAFASAKEIYGKDNPYVDV